LVEDLVQEAGGITGVRVRIAGKTTAFAARRVVVLAAYSANTSAEHKIPENTLKDLSFCLDSEAHYNLKISLVFSWI
jgi:hypothetical protein